MQSFPLDETLHFFSVADTATSTSDASFYLIQNCVGMFCIGNHDPMSRISWFLKRKYRLNFATFVNARKYLNFLINYNDHC